VFTVPENVFVSQHPLIQHKLSILRDKSIEPKKFRELIAIAMLLAMKRLAIYASGQRMSKRPGDRPLPGTDRYHRPGSGLARGLHVEGIWEMMPAPVWHIGLFRDERTRAR
jgi:uracil phosphoribosyltransferase